MTTKTNAGGGNSGARQHSLFSFGWNDPDENTDLPQNKQRGEIITRRERETLAAAKAIHAARREHSRKPDEAYVIIERMYPNLPKIELFARHARTGWEAWGNEAPSATSAIPPASDFLLKEAER
jgi:hypothetical protein